MHTRYGRRPPSPERRRVSPPRRLGMPTSSHGVVQEAQLQGRTEVMRRGGRTSVAQPDPTPDLDLERELESQRIRQPPRSPSPPSPTPQGERQPRSPLRREESEDRDGRREQGQPPQVVVNQEEWTRLMNNIADIHRHNEHLQAQLDHIRQEKEYYQGGLREAETLNEFRPFSPEVETVAIPDNMKTLVLESYSGATDPREHLLYFNTKMVISAASDAVKCRMFPSTFKSTAMEWFTTLPPGAIQNFTDFSSRFLTQFSANQNQKITIDDLYNIRQQPNETLKQYVSRFSNVSVKVEDMMPGACVGAFKNGLRPGPLNSKLSRKPARGMAELRSRAQAYIMEEEDDMQKRKRDGVEKASTQAREDQQTRREGKAPYQGRNRAVPYSRPNEDARRPWQTVAPVAVPNQGRTGWGSNLNTTVANIYREVRETNLIQEPAPAKRPPPNVDRTKWCEYHKTLGHNTDDCYTLKREIERLIKAGHLKKFTGETRRRGVGEGANEKEGGGEEGSNPLGPPAGFITSIAGGFGGGGETSAARKRHVRAVYSVQEVEFGFDHPDIVISKSDFKGVKPHKDDPIVVQLRVNNFDIQRVLLDQGSSADIIYGDAFDKLGLNEGDLEPYVGNLVSFTGERVWVRGYVELETIFGECQGARKLKVKYLVLQCKASYNIIIGRQTLNKVCVVISTAHLAVKFPLANGKVGAIKVDQVSARHCYSESVELYGKKNVEAGHRCHEISTAEVDAWDPRGEDRVSRPEPAEATKKLQLGERTLKIGTKLTIDQERRLGKLLEENLDLFAWTIKDVPGIDPNFICHRLALNPGVKPVTQLRRKMGDEKNRAVRQETAKLLEGQFIREIKYPTWLANVVMVKKANGKWRMCTDYTDLNKACPKDSYPLPNIDKLVDGASGNELLSLMDAYSGYNQIRMHPSDEEKTAFMTAQVNYCYRTMPFGLKNAGATYQRLMDNVFEKQVGRNMEVYVDDMIVKSVVGSTHCEDLSEAFGEIRKHKIRLNPEKCSFGIQGGKFLGFMVTSRGIEINPDKCKAIQEMAAPRNVKDVQRLTGRLAALARFLSHTGERAAPFFKCLRKNEKFEWTSECDEALQRLKDMLNSPPILTKPKQGLPLLLYVSVTERAISSVLIQEIEGEQRAVYFVSHTLQGAEVRYQKIEKAALAVLITSRRLRPYFQTFQVKVKTDLPLRQVLQKPDLSGRLVGWSVELSEYGLQYEIRGKLGAQVLADFVVELTPVPGGRDPPLWTLFVDGSSNQKGGGAGVTLEGPGELNLEQSLRFEFKTSNNQAEYEALIAGLKLAIEVGVQNLLVRTDSQLVANQVTDVFQVKEFNLIKYVERVRYLLKRIQTVEVKYVPREQNQRADALAKLASTRRPGQYKTVIQETLMCPSIEGEMICCVDRSNTWMGPILEVMAGTPEEAARHSKMIHREASYYTLIDGHLFRRGFTSPLLKCVGPTEAAGIMSEVHEGVCASHIGGRSLAAKVLRAGFYWPTLRKDCQEFVKKCDKCQVYADLHRAPPAQLTTITSPWPFAMWGVDLVGPFPVARSQMKFIIVGVDYFTKWIEAEPLATITSNKVINFYWRRIVCRFGVPKVIVSDNGAQFTGKATREFCAELGISMRFTSVEHPQSNGQAESANKVILAGIKKRLDEAKGRWIDELPVVLWAYNTTPQSTTGETPFRLTYGADAMLPVEIENGSWRVMAMEEEANQQNLITNLDLIPEVREEGRIREAAIKQKMASKYDSRVVPRAMKEGDLVLKKRMGTQNVNKFTPNWEGPYRIQRVLGQGAYHLEELGGQKVPRSWNAANLRRYYS